MAFDKAMAHLRAKGFGDRVIVPQEETATVEEAAAASGTLVFWVIIIRSLMSWISQ